MSCYCVMRNCWMGGSTFVHDELALGAAQVAHINHGDVIAGAHGVLEGVRMLHGRPAHRAADSMGGLNLD